ncbi:WbqC family protein [Vibrio nereis]|uniref:WbqC family protein n=1 Tax=Vibrio nereis TaxID=693 RepID=UPI002493D95E|nr:WbqC family protein [Vibrio nereis]
MKVAILQSNYIPWKGVFDMINQVDVFVFFEDVDYTKRDWRTRNRIRSLNSDVWLSVPVKKAPRGTKISEIRISQDSWRKKHKKSIIQSYCKAPYFEEYRYLLDDIYDRDWEFLSDFNIYTTKLLCKALGIECHFVNSVDIQSSGKKDDKILSICESVGASEYISGPAAKDYIDASKFENRGIKLHYIDYSSYREYKQIHGGFDHFVSVLDLIFNCGGSAKDYIENKI